MDKTVRAQRPGGGPPTIPFGRDPSLAPTDAATLVKFNRSSRRPNFDTAEEGLMRNLFPWDSSDSVAAKVHPKKRPATGRSVLPGSAFFDDGFRPHEMLFPFRPRKYENFLFSSYQHLTSNDFIQGLKLQTFSIVRVSNMS